MSMEPLHFIGWNKPAIELVADEAEKLWRQDAVSFAQATLVVPTAESGRRLREYLAERAGKPLLMPRMVLISRLLADAQGHAADEAETQAAWLEVLTDLQKTELTAEKLAEPDSEWSSLFPVPPLGSPLTWAENTAACLRGFRRRLEQEMVEGAYAEAIRNDISLSRERREDKWVRFFERMGTRCGVIKKLFERVDTLIRSHSGKMTQEEARAELVAHPTWRGSYLIMACVPEVTPQIRCYLEHLSSRMPVHIWVNADADSDAAAHLDAFGQPMEDDYWLSEAIDIPSALVTDAEGRADDARSAIHLVQDARAMGAKAVELAEGFGPQQVALISCDSEMDAALCAAFAHPAAGAPWTLFAPAGRVLSGTPAAQLPAQLLTAVQMHGRYPMFNEQTQQIENNGATAVAALEPLLRNRVMQWMFAAFQGEEGKVIPMHFNYCLDKVMQVLLPGSVRDLTRRLGSAYELSRYAEVEESLFSKQYQIYARWVNKVAEELGAPETCAVRLRKLEKGLSMLAESPVPAEQTELLREPLRRVAELAEAAAPGGDPLRTLALLNHLVTKAAENSVQPTLPKQETQADLLGWKESTFAGGERVLLCGMHNHCVPERPEGDGFLPDALRCDLGITSSRSREARDAFLLTALLHSRPAGAVQFLVAHQQADGTPVAPSTLLLHCGADVTELAERAAYLFGDAPESAGEPPYEERTLMQAAQPAEGQGETIELLGKSPADNPYSREGGLQPFSPSRLNAFLNCPLRFWLKLLFNLSPNDVYQEDKVDLDAREFGNEMHEVLQAFTERFRSLTDVPAELPMPLGEWLADEMESMLNTAFHRKFGAVLSFPLAAQLQLLTANLRLFAAQEAERLEAGWVNVFCEFPLKPTLDLGGEESPARFTMRADRIDYNPVSGCWRIIDYKSNDVSPDQKHYASCTADSPYAQLMGVGELLIRGTTGGKPNNLSYRRSDVQLPLYAYGLRKLAEEGPAEGRAAELWAEAEARCPEYLERLTPETMPELCYCNIPKTKVEVALNTLHSRDKSGNSFRSPMDEEGLENALEWVRHACALVRRGACLYSAEYLGITPPAGDFEQLAPLSDPRSLCGLPVQH